MSECSVEHLKWGATWPSREQFHELADAGYRVVPIVRRLLADSLTPVGFYERLAGGRSGTFILESAEYGGTWSRYSFIGVNSMAQLRSNNGQADWLGKVPVGSRRSEGPQSPAGGGSAEPDQRSGRHSRLGCDSSLGTDLERRGPG